MWNAHRDGSKVVRQMLLLLLLLLLLIVDLISCTLCTSDFS